MIIFKKRVNRIDVRDYMIMRQQGLPTTVKWGYSKNLKLDNGLTLKENCVKYIQPSDEALIDEPSIETLKKIDRVFKLTVW